MSDWTWTATPYGYQVFFRGAPAGGAGTARGGRRLGPKARKANLAMYRLQGRATAEECEALSAHLPYDPKVYEEAGVWGWLPAARAARLRAEREVSGGLA